MKSKKENAMLLTCLMLKVLICLYNLQLVQGYYHNLVLENKNIFRAQKIGKHKIHLPFTCAVHGINNFPPLKSSKHGTPLFSPLYAISQSADHHSHWYKTKLSLFSQAFSLYTPLWTLLAALSGVLRPDIVATAVGSLGFMQRCVAVLMLSMGLTITPLDIKAALLKPTVILTNAVFCFGLMPFLGIILSQVFSFTSSQTTGIVLLGSVSGGQASNLFALLAGGDVALSVICTISTTLLGVLLTPFLVKFLIGYAVVVNGVEVLKSVASLVLLPLFFGLGLSQLIPQVIGKISPVCPLLGICATLLLVAGGAANSAASINFATILISCLLPVLGGTLALLLSHLTSMSESSRRTLVVETLSKSPTLAYVLAVKHFGEAASAIPAASMVSLAFIGAITASLWSRFSPLASRIKVID